MFMRGDLHIHSTASDGRLSPRQIVLIAKNRGIDTIAISDHNSIAGIAEASEAGEKYGISVIPAIELSTRFNDESIHVLGYFTNEKYNSYAFEKILKLIRAHEANSVRKVLEGYRKHQIADKYLSTPDGIFLLKTFGAAVVLAHPVRISEENLPSVLELPFDGIEARYCRSSNSYTNYFIKIALEKFHFYTAGSDFHTDDVNDRKHSFIGEPYLDSDEIERFLKNSKALVLGHSTI